MIQLRSQFPISHQTTCTTTNFQQADGNSALVDFTRFYYSTFYDQLWLANYVTVYIWYYDLW